MDAGAAEALPGAVGPIQRAFPETGDDLVRRPVGQLVEAGQAGPGGLLQGGGFGEGVLGPVGPPQARAGG